MPEVHKLDTHELERARSALPRWQLDATGAVLVREYRFDDFTQAFAFMTTMALWSEAQDHHPEWTNIYNRVRVRLTTHDAGGLTTRDLAWARRADAVYGRE